MDPAIHTESSQRELNPVNIVIAMKTRSILLFAFLLLSGTPMLLAADCREAEFGKCFNVHGRYAIYADGDAIWLIGTKRLLSTTDDKLDNMLEKAGWEDYTLYGDFTVCPLSRYQPGHRQNVCIQSYRKIKLAKRQ